VRGQSQRITAGKRGDNRSALEHVDGQGTTYRLTAKVTKGCHDVEYYSQFAGTHQCRGLRYY
jgi:hypothetical protein